MDKDTTKALSSKKIDVKSKSPIEKKVTFKIVQSNFSRKLAEKNPNSPRHKAYTNSQQCSSFMVVENGDAHTHYCHSPFCPICERIQTAHNINKFLPIMTYLQSKGKEFYLVTLTKKNCETNDPLVLRAFMQDMNNTWSNCIRSRKHFRELDLSGILKKECTYHTLTNGLWSFHYHFHLIVDSKDGAIYITEQWKHLYDDPNVVDARFQQYKKIKNISNACLEVFKYTSKAAVGTEVKGKNGHKKRGSINYNALDCIYQAMHGMQRMTSFGKFREMIGDEALNSFNDDELSKEITNLTCEDGYYTWYMSVKDGIADWFNIQTGEALAQYTPTSKDIFLQDYFTKEQDKLLDAPPS